MAGATCTKDGKQYITENRVWTGTNGTRRRARLTGCRGHKNPYSPLGERRKAEQSQAKEERARVSAKIRAAFQSREHETGHER